MGTRHKMYRTFFYRTALNNWYVTLEEGLRFALEQMRGAKNYGSLCYQKTFPPEVRKKFRIRKREEYSGTAIIWAQTSVN